MKSFLAHHHPQSLIDELWRSHHAIKMDGIRWPFLALQARETAEPVVTVVTVVTVTISKEGGGAPF